VTKETGQGSVSAVRRSLVWITVGVFANAAAVAYLIVLVGHLEETFRWAVVPGIVAAAANMPAGPGDSNGGHVVVELFSDFACVYCRETAPAIDSVRAHFGNAVAWRYRFLPRAPQIDPVGFSAALAGWCLGPQHVWDFYRVIASADRLSRGAVDSAIEATSPTPILTRQCMDAPSSADSLWSAKVRAAARGITATPTVEVDGIRVHGLAHTAALVDLVDEAIRRRTSRQSNASNRPH
jgi:hypothetical protein